MIEHNIAANTAIYQILFRSAERCGYHINFGNSYGDYICVKMVIHHGLPFLIDLHNNLVQIKNHIHPFRYPKRSFTSINTIDLIHK